MESCNSHSRWALGLAGAVFVLVLGGCGSADVVDIEFGGLTVNTVTSGENIDPNANCAVGPNPVNVNVITGSTSNALFTLVCI